MGFLENSGKACARVDPPGSVNQMAEPSSASDREQAVAAARKRGLTKAELEQRLEAHRIDRHFKAATQVAHAGAIEQAGIIRRLFTERLDAYKWIAALSTAAFFFVGQAVGAAGRSIGGDPAIAALVAQACFLVSVFGAALYMFGVDTRASKWHRALFIRTSHIRGAHSSTSWGSSPDVEYVSDPRGWRLAPAVSERSSRAVRRRLGASDRSSPG